MSKKDYLVYQYDSFSNSVLVLFGIYIVSTIFGLIRISLKRK